MMNIVTEIINETVLGRRNLRIAVGLAKIFQILAVVFGTEIDWHAHSGSSDVKVDIYSTSSYVAYSTSSLEHSISTLDRAAVALSPVF
jgi:hypothetical protein